MGIGLAVPNAGNGNSAGGTEPTNDTLFAGTDNAGVNADEQETSPGTLTAAAVPAPAEFPVAPAGELAAGLAMGNTPHSTVISTITCPAQTWVGREWAEGEEDVRDLPCLSCGICDGVASMGGKRYMDENFERQYNGWWVNFCQCSGNLQVQAVMTAPQLCTCCVRGA